MNLGGPDSPEAVQPFLRRLFADPEVIQLGWLSFTQPLFAWAIARSRAPRSREAYAQIGGKSPIREESTAQVQAVVDELDRRGIAARPYVAMACWHPFSEEAVAAMEHDGVTRAIALPLYPHYSRTTTGSSFRLLERALKGKPIEVKLVDRYPDHPGYVQAVAERIEAAQRELPPVDRTTTPVLFSAHGLPEAYIRRGDPYLDQIRITVAAVSARLQLGERAHLSFQSRVGPQKWLAPTTTEAIAKLAAAGHRSLLVCPVAFTGEHIETLQEIDIEYRDHARAAGITRFVRALTVGCHPAFIGALADLAEAEVRKQRWV